MITVAKSNESDRYGKSLKLHRDAVFGEVSNTPLRQQKTVIPTIAESGTSLAIDHYTLGGVALLPKKSGRGGARNHVHRESNELTTAQIANLIAAERHSAAIDLPLNRMLTIHWEAAGLPLNRMVEATGRFIDLMSKALARRKSRTAWIWVLENGDRKGGHCHLLAHVPAEHVKSLTSLQRGWLRRITGNPYRARVIHSKPIGGRLGLENNNPKLYQTNLSVVLGYILKGASDHVAVHFVLERVEAGGRIIGKRCGTSQNIGTKARNERKNDGDEDKAPPKKPTRPNSSCRTTYG